MGAVFYLIHDIMVKTNMFLIAGYIRQVRGTMDMTRLGGLYKAYPLISLLIALVLFSWLGCHRCRASGQRSTCFRKPSWAGSISL